MTRFLSSILCGIVSLSTPVVSQAVTFQLSAVVTDAVEGNPTGLAVGDPLSWLVTFDTRLRSIPGEFQVPFEEFPIVEHRLGQIVTNAVIHPTLILRDGVPIFLSTQVEPDTLPPGTEPFVTDFNVRADVADVRFGRISGVDVLGSDLRVEVVPEPGTLVLLVSGLFVLWMLWRGRPCVQSVRTE